jgi:hypothetical protein
MKKNLLVLITLCFLAINQTNAQTIPNGSFEHWSLVAGVETPDGGWQVSQTLICTPLSSSKTSDKQDSSFAILLESSNCQQTGGNVHEGFAIIDVPITNKPAYLNGYYKSSRINTDSSVIEVVIKNGTTIIGRTEYKITGNASSYTSFSIPIVYTLTTTPTSAQLLFFSDRIAHAVLGNKLWIDHLSFSATPATINEPLQNSNILVYPNPTTSIITLKIAQHLVGENYSILNPVGIELKRGKLNSELNTININELEAGIYFVKVGKADARLYKVMKY